MTQPDPHTPRLVSDFAGDPEMQELVELFVSELPSRVSKLSATWQQAQLDEVKRLAHQLKGASAGYGFPAIGAAAGKLENSLRTLQTQDDASLTSLKRELDQRIDLCNRAAA